MKKTNFSLRMIALLLSLILTAVSIPLAIIAEDVISTQNENTENTTNTENSEALIEDLSKRDKFTKHYAAPDGQRYAVVFSEQVHYENDGEWIEVDNRLTYDTATKRYETANEIFSADFAANAGDESLVSISDGEYTISWSVLFPTPIGGSISANSNAQLINNGETASVTTVDNMENMGKAATALRYNGLGSGNVDLRYTVLHGKVEEDIILNSLDSFSTYMLSVDTGGLTVAVDEYGSVTFSDADGNVIFTIAAPWMMDANSEISDAILVEAVQKGDLALIAYTPDRSWLSDSERAFPVLIDPSFTTRYYTNNYVDTYVSEEETTPNLSKSTAVRLKLGKSRGYYNCPYIKILNVPDFRNSCYSIVDVKFNAWVGGYTGRSEAFLYEVNNSWNVSTITYANQPSSTLITSEELILLDEEFQTLSKYEFDITDWFISKTSESYSFFNSYQWHGFKMDLPTTLAGNILTVFSSEYSTTDHRPTLTIEYAYTPEEFLLDGGIYKFSVNSQGYMSVANGTNAGDNVYYYDSYSYNANDDIRHSQEFRLRWDESNNAFLISTIRENAENCEDGECSNTNCDVCNPMILTYDYVDETDQINIYREINSQVSSESKYWIIECVNRISNSFRIASKCDPNIAFSIDDVSNGSHDNYDVSSPGNIYAGTDPGWQGWKIESGGIRLKSNHLNIEQRISHSVYLNDTNTSFFCPIYYVGDTVTWSSTNTSVATIDNNGNIILKEIGITIIRATVLHPDNTTVVYSCTLSVYLPDGEYVIKNSQSGNYIDVNDNSEAFQNELHVFVSERWTLEREYDDFYRLKSLSNNMYLSVSSNDETSICFNSEKNDYNLWKIQKGSQENLRLSCYATQTDQGIFSLSLSINGSTGNIQQSVYVNDSDTKDDWNLYKINGTVNLNVIYDNSYAARSANANENVITKINGHTSVLQEKFLYEFGILINPSQPTLFTSYAETCTTDTGSDPTCHCDGRECRNCAMSGNTNHHTNAYENIYRIESPDKEIELTLAYIGHTICGMNGDEHSTDVLGGYAVPGKGVIVVFWLEDYDNDTLTMATVHEFGHIYGAPDHYGYGRPTTADLNNSNLGIQYSSECIYGEELFDTINISNRTICDGCKFQIKSNAELYNHDLSYYD